MKDKLKTGGAHSNGDLELDSRKWVELVLTGIFGATFLLFATNPHLVDQLLNPPPPPIDPHPCVIHQDANLVVIRNTWCTSGPYNSNTDVQYFKDLGYTITGVGNYRIYMEK